MLRVADYTRVYRRALLTVCSLVFVCFLPACNPHMESPLRIGTNIFPGYEPLYLARNLGYYDGSEINLIEMPSSSAVIQSLRSGVLEGATLTLDELLTLVQDGLELEVVLIMDFSMGADVLLAKPEIETIAELRGKRIAFEFTAVGAILLDATLSEAKLSTADVEIVDCSPAEHIDCYLSMDAVITFDPSMTEILKLGATTLFDSSQIPGRIVDVLVVSSEYASKNPRTLERLLAGYFDARRYFDQQPQDAAERMASRMGLMPAEVLSSFRGLELPSLDQNYYWLSGNPSLLQLAAKDLAQFMHERNLLRLKPELKELSNNQFLPIAEQ